MKEIKFLRSFGDIDEKYILEAENYVPKKRSFLKYAASFAALLFISTAAIPFIIGGAGAGNDSAVKDTQGINNGGGRGMHIVSVHDINEFIDKNPWNEDAGYISLPVYKNMAFVNMAGVTAYHPEEDMLSIAEKTAEVLGEEINEYSFFRESDRGFLMKNEEGIYENDKTYDLDAKTSNYSISVYGNGNVDIDFPYTPISVADDENVKETTSRGEEEIAKKKTTVEDAVNKYVKNNSDIIGFDNAVISVTADYGLAGDIYYSCTAYEKSEDTLQSVLNYNFSSVRFYTGDSGEITKIAKDDILSSAEEVGEYLIISKDEAKQKLIDGEHMVYDGNAGEYLESDDKINEDDIAYSTLVYSNAPTDEYFVPYYIFYVETDDASLKKHYADKDLKHYSVYYVMAVKED